jgi:serine/threonine-protein phosphatase 2A regulatory subunit A
LFLSLCSDNLIQLAEAVGQELVREELIGHYVLLLKDNEAEVRTAASGQIPGVKHAFAMNFEI